MRPMERKRFFAARQRARSHGWNCDPIFSIKQILMLHYPLYSPDLAPCDFFLFLQLKAHKGRTLRQFKGHVKREN